MNSKIVKIIFAIMLILSLNSCHNTKKAEESFKRGMKFFELNNFQEAIKDFDDAINEYPKYEQAYYQRGLSKEQLGMYREAMKDFEKANEINPKNSNYIYHKSFCEGYLLEKSKINKNIDK